jgi:LCP family protein required for cell wall assembly
MGRAGPLIRFVAVVTAVVVIVAAAAISIVVRAGDGASTAHAQEVASPAVEIHAAHGSSYVPALEGKRPLFILALGSDARPGEPVAGERSDSIHIIGIDLRTRSATILGFPRDSWVNIPGHGTSKINNATAFGGPQLMVRTLEALTGIRIDFWLLTSFGDFIDMVNSVGGVTVNVPYAMHDSYSGANFPAGRQRLTGGEALALARNRHDTPKGDFSRSANQGLLMKSGLAELRKDFERRPALLFSWIAAVWRNIQTDLPASTLIDLALTATQVSPSKVKNVVVPGTNGFAGSAAVVYISPSARSIYADMRADGVVG